MAIKMFRDDAKKHVGYWWTEETKYEKKKKTFEMNLPHEDQKENVSRKCSIWSRMKRKWEN